MNDTVLGTVAGAWRLAVDYLRDRRQAWQTLGEFDRLDPHEAARVLAEAGMTAAEFRQAAARPFAFEDLMAEGMASVGIDPAEVAAEDGEWFRYLQRNCAMCRLRGRCRRLMATSEFAARFHAFCPNSADFDRILAAKARGASPSERLDTAYLN